MFKIDFSDQKFRAIIIQTIVVGLLAYGLYWIVQTTAYNLEKRNIATGFGFLNDPAGFDISFTPFFSFVATDSHFNVYLVGLVNTLLISVVGCIAATFLGFFVGITRLSSNWLLSKIAYVYVEITRNIPLILQLLFWYALLINLPRVKNSIAIGETFFLNNRGFLSPQPIPGDNFIYVTVTIILTIIASIIFARWAKKTQEKTGKQYPVALINIFSIILFPVIIYFISGSPMEFERPVLKGFNFVGGMQMPPEFVAMFLGLSIYTASFISEIVRAGILSVGKGQIEAANSLGLSQKVIMNLIIIPQAMRVIVPPLTSQFLNLTKNSSLGIAIGYADLVHGFGGISLNQTGQAIECMAIVMATYLVISLLISFFMNIYNRSIQLEGR
jgi:general L-amino acid transport system permease protein|tara:strand:- start:1799 stop:2956 length:1158 start_codon:yes stop_codon:yes gene_type:complete